MVDSLKDLDQVSGEPQFTREDFAKLKQSQELLFQAQALLPKLESCGMDCEYFRDAIAEYGEKLGRWERAFFTGPDWAGITPATPGLSVLGPIFSRGDWERLKRIQRIIHDTLPKLDQAEACGLDCSAFKSELADRAERLTGLEREFMSPPPT